MVLRVIGPNEPGASGMPINSNYAPKSSSKNKTEETPMEKAIRECKEKGGTWDPQAKKCTLPSDVKDEINEKKRREGEIASGTEIITDKEGKQVGITIDGKMYGGLRPKEVAQIAARQQEKETLPAGTAPLGTEQAAMKAALEQQELVATGSPERRELDPTVTDLEKIPVIGPLTQKIADLMIGVRRKLGLAPPKPLLGETPEESIDLQPEELRTLALSEIEKQEIERGLTTSEKFGSFAESVPAGELSKWIPGLSDAERPSDNVQTVLKSLRVLKTTAIDVELKYNKGLLTNAQAQERLTEIDNEVQRGESRMKMLIQDSPELKFNSDGVNFIELKILETRQRTFDSRVALVNPPSSVASDIDILLALKQGVASESFDIPGYD